MDWVADSDGFATLSLFSQSEIDRLCELCGAKNLNELKNKVDDKMKDVQFQ